MDWSVSGQDDSVDSTRKQLCFRSGVRPKSFGDPRHSSALQSNVGLQHPPAFELCDVKFVSDDIQRVVPE